MQFHPNPIFKFILYVADDTPNSCLAKANLRIMCEEHLPGRHEIEVVDVLKDPERAKADSVIMTPVLILLSPGPRRQITGTLNEQHRVIHALGLDDLAA